MVEVDPGEVIAREDRGDFWFFVVVAGAVRFSRRGVVLHEIGSGGFFGHETALGLRPQPATATATEPTTLIVLSAQYFVSLLNECPRFQRRMFPDVRPRDYRAFATEMHRVGRVEWRQVSADLAIRIADPAVTSGAGPAAQPHADRLPGRRLSLREAAERFMPPVPPAAVDVAVHHVAAPVATASRDPMPKWLAPAVAAVGLVALAIALFAYHPPRAVISPARPVDLTADITIDGHPAAPLHGRYVLLSVNVSRPTLARYLLARYRGTTTVRLHDDDAADVRAARRLGRQQYLDSQRTAIVRAEAESGVAPAAVTVHIRDRGYQGPSAGLVYAMAVADALSGRQCAAGRVVAATGAIDGRGRVGAVGWVSLKLRVAERAHADVVFVADGETAPGAAAGGLQVRPVTSLAQARAEECAATHSGAPE